ncbi:hypothetical protein VNI00_008446 [Paramarasmius palmivorus]|uniref:Uncharacterized protein n=1 Tax=Paramarasmius palmivorus TaxID=297713 RepID=A0AAW0CW40_9AGAR
MVVRSSVIRSLYKPILLATSTFITLIFIYTQTAPESGFTLSSFFGAAREIYTCPPEAYSNGSWILRPWTNRTVMTDREDAVEFSGFEGCASSAEYFWHLAADREEQWDRFPAAQSWRWEPNDKEQCRMPAFSGEAMVRDLVQNGGWLVLGDSVSENHFFSMSCSLYPHVTATPDYTTDWYDRGHPQNLYLNPASPLVKRLKFPKGFDIAKTPLMTFRRVDLLFEESELVELHRSLYNPPADFQLFSDEAVWTLSPEYYLNELLTRPLPEGNYGALVVSTAGHWTTTLFSGYRDESKDTTGYGIDGVIGFFGKAMEAWADRVQEAINDDKGVVLSTGKRKKRETIVRAYLPGHEDCHSHRAPWTEIEPFVWNWYNWGNIWEYNEIFTKLLSSAKYPNIHFVGIDRPARLRPDAHATGDCLHIMTGAGVMEGWTHYLWHFASNEIGFRLRGSH